MGQDLFSCDLDTLTYQDVADFVALGQEEGVRIDYKETVPQHFGDLVTAFSNTLGGIAVIGVKKTAKAPTSIPGVVRGATDLKTQLANKIISTVYPRPIFSIGVVAHGVNPTNDVAIVRVEDGREAPFMYLQKKKVSVRVEDQNARASLVDLENLFHRRQRPLGAHLANENRDLFVPAMSGESPLYAPSTQRSETYMRVWISPTRPVNILLHHTLEQQVLGTLTREFADYGDIQVGDRSADFVDFRFDAAHLEDFSARWRLTTNSSLGFVVQTVNKSGGGVYLLDVAFDALRTVKVATKLIRQFGWHGRTILSGMMVVGDAEVFPHGSEQPDFQVEGIREVGSRRTGSVLENRAVFDTVELSALSSFVSDMFLRSLRSERGADIDFDRLQAFMKKFATQIERS